jgi:hypothetical protein
MIRQNVLVGVIVVALCVMVASRDRWVLDHTKKGKRLVDWFGPDRAIWVLRLLLFIGIVFGGLLAAGIIRPIQW